MRNLCWSWFVIAGVDYFVNQGYQSEQAMFAFMGLAIMFEFIHWLEENKCDH